MRRGRALKFNLPWPMVIAGDWLRRKFPISRSCTQSIPFLDQEEYILHAFCFHLLKILHFSRAFFSVYHAVLALGRQYHQDSSPESESGRAWNVSWISLGYMSDILVPPHTLWSIYRHFSPSWACLFLCRVNECVRNMQTLLKTRAPTATPKGQWQIWWSVIVSLRITHVRKILTRANPNRMPFPGRNICGKESDTKYPRFYHANVGIWVRLCHEYRLH